MRSLRILCDLDGVVTDLLEKWLGDYNRDFGDNLGVENIKTPEVSEWVKPEARQKIYDYINSDRYFRDLNPIPGSIGTLKSLEGDGHDVFIVTAPSNNPMSAADKISWVSENLGFDRKKVIVCNQKYVCEGDVFIDDTPKKIQAYRESWPDAHILTIAYPYNEEAYFDVDLAAESWKRPKKAWQTIREYIDTLAK